MKDVKIIFNGDASTINLTEEVNDKNLYEQKVLINMVTEKGSDPVYADRGTDLLADSIRGKVYSRSGTIHVGNFAALDTIYFIRNTEPSYVKGEPYTLQDINVSGISYNNEDNVLNLSVQVIYTDETSTEIIADLPALS
jgi:hypothetical protein